MKECPRCNELIGNELEICPKTPCFKYDTPNLVHRSTNIRER